MSKLLTPHDIQSAMTIQKPGVVVRVAVDALGGDHAPEAVVEGALLAAGELLRVVLVGPPERLAALLPAGGHPHIEIVPATDKISSGDEPVEAVRNRPDSSLVVAARLLADGRADAFVSMGNTGAALAAGLLHVHRIKGVLRPALCTLLPAVPLPIVFLDAGANAEVRPEGLRQFAVLGQTFAREMLGIERPSVGLLSIGEEPSKGTQAVIEAHRLIAADPQINFYGNVEGRDLSHHVVDVIVADGFAGNIALKVFEGTARTIVGEIRNAVLGSLRAKIGAAIMSRDLRKISEALDPEQYGGAYLLGLRRPMIVGHGSSRARGIASGIRTASRGVTSELLPTIARRVGGDDSQSDSKSGAAVRDAGR
ncbi:MAG TPA: phosphate acyltransferase PlsX [Thermoleophilia bacterium]|nr:phosphate acyltransferase PlsX [Thermoleophilia bacterium]